MPPGERAACPSSSIVGRAPERTAEPPQEEAGPQGPRWLMKVRKGFLEVDPPLHQPQKKRKQLYRYRKNVNVLAVQLWLFTYSPLVYSVKMLYTLYTESKSVMYPLSVLFEVTQRRCGLSFMKSTAAGRWGGHGERARLQLLLK